MPIHKAGASSASGIPKGTPQSPVARKAFKTVLLKRLAVLGWTTSTLATQAGVALGTIQNYINLKGKGVVRPTVVFAILEALFLPPVSTVKECGFDRQFVGLVRDLALASEVANATILQRVDTIIATGTHYLQQGAPEAAKTRFRQAIQSARKFVAAGLPPAFAAPTLYKASIGLLDSIARTGRDVAEALVLTDTLMTLCEEDLNWDQEKGDLEARVYGWRADIRCWQSDYAGAFKALELAQRYVKTPQVEGEIARTHLHLMRNTRSDETFSVLKKATALWEILHRDTHEWLCLGQACAITWAAFEPVRALAIIKEVSRGFQEEWVDKLLYDHLSDTLTAIRYARIVAVPGEVCNPRVAYATAQYGLRLAHVAYPRLADEARRVLEIVTVHGGA